ncbi:MAG: hypothetical protein J7513_18110 [Solirubrobacteraceae bacterium]|nr:hypothetical protein [Solirubrobacteraceae bacterium]
MTRFDFDDDGEIPGASDAALPGRDLENPETDRLATDSLDDLRDQELGGGASGAYGDDGPVDPAMAAVIEAGGGVSEGFEQSEEELIENATDSYGSTRDILFDAIDEDVDDEDYDDDGTYGEADEARSSADWDDDF